MREIVFTSSLVFCGRNLLSCIVDFVLLLIEIQLSQSRICGLSLLHVVINDPNPDQLDAEGHHNHGNEGSRHVQIHKAVCGMTDSFQSWTGNKKEGGFPRDP